ncbi:MAG TPA: DUF2541 family protein [Cyclobacteriaceae bacterium]|nr:DUF2541 family protein [Cyclobacteriaceae bacterium]HMV10715.1 DUF2541 family protein [Cyclobacteriaceae bacterium]HMV91136.1 DUF2541 family protein [Cyclobacteriaceae bacterium]HMX00046.1 DUF2541 family protein [Cyclobacteriaceae bacterium]HMX49092.1 DUF2541 family protein [Cyclobacteriaceae bacterium]
MKKINVLFAILFMTVTLVSSLVAKAQTSSVAEDWQQLGTHVVDYMLDYDVIPVTYKKGTFTTLKFRVTDGNINMHRCMITYENGDKQEIEIKHQFTANSEKVVDLKGNNRIIEKITFWYDTKNASARKAVIEAWGKK